MHKMKLMHRLKICNMVSLMALFIWALPTKAAAYVDPGTTGMLSQVMYVLIYGVLGIFLTSLKYPKSWVARAKTFLAGLFSHQP